VSEERERGVGRRERESGLLEAVRDFRSLGFGYLNIFSFIYIFF